MNIQHRPKVFGIIGVVAAFLGLLAVLIGPTVHDAIYPKPRIEDRIADTAVKIRDRVVARLKGAPPAETRVEFRVSSSEFPYSLSLALVAVAIVGGCVSYLRREDHRLAYVACGVGTLTLAWHAVLLALGALVLCAIIFAVCSSLGIS
jgi:hypothetical protein